MEMITFSALHYWFGIRKGVCFVKVPIQ